MIEFIEDAHLYLYNGIIVKSVTQILHETIFKNKYKDVPKWILDRKARYGSKVHSIIEKLENEEEYVLDSEYVKASINQYLEIKDKYSIKVLSQEEVV